MKVFVNLKDIDAKKPDEIIEFAGGKGFGIWAASKISLNCPETWIVLPHLFDEFLKNVKINASHDYLKVKAEKFIIAKLSEEFKKLPDNLYAVRSSSLAEDSSKKSFAGMFETKLKVKKEDIPEAIAHVWLSGASKRVATYSNHRCQKMAVLIQPMVIPKFSGVCFSQHPMPANFRENGNYLVEFIAGFGEKLVQGEVTPTRLSGKFTSVAANPDYPWAGEILSAARKLEISTSVPVDVEFSIDERGKLWILQQRPVTKIISSNVLDMMGYKKAYKRALCSLDIECLVDGCVKYLAPYLDISLDLSSWMIMLTNKIDAQQELWLNEPVDEEIIKLVADRISSDPSYLLMLEARYRHHHRRILNWRQMDWAKPDLPLIDRLADFFEFIGPINAHYYAPMHIIEALSRLVLEKMRQINHEDADNDFFVLATSCVNTLRQLFVDNCEETQKLIIKTIGKIPPKIDDLPKNLKEKMCTLEERFGFLNCHQPYETPYALKEIYEMIKEPLKNDESHIKTAKLDLRYASSCQWQKMFDHLKIWLNIRNQEMEYLYYVYSKAISLLSTVGKRLGISLKEVWNRDRAYLLDSLRKRTKKVIIYRHNKLVIANDGSKTVVSDKIEPIFPMRNNKQIDIKGKTAYGAGEIFGKIKVAFTPEELKKLPMAAKDWIIVTGMTTPDFVPFLINKARGLITDEGGILCHAAIIAREINLPCIVGTGIASEKLKDNFRVKMDLDRATIDIL